ncbi:unnamed protein product, partial [Vitis vinifera]|uniref:Uncharacterized protein n=1 Tax=Vitis vinifera TaxID=29760 RepID=D7SQW7_VITVI
MTQAAATSLVMMGFGPSKHYGTDAEKDLKGDDQLWHSLSSKNFIEPLIRFLKDACGQHDVKAQRVRSQLLLELVNKIEMQKHPASIARASNQAAATCNENVKNGPSLKCFSSVLVILNHGTIIQGCTPI